MNLREIIDSINALNEQGVQLALKSPADYEKAISKHHEAVVLVGQHNVNPDYLAFSVANEGYARRQKGENRGVVLGLLENLIGEMPSLMCTWISKDDAFCKESYSGRARLLEEAALVRRYTPSSEIVQDLTQALSQLRDAVLLYQRAAENVPAEILPAEKIESRLWRTYGITAAVATELARNDSNRKKEHLQTASSYAQQELDARLAVGEIKGLSLLNAYHTLGVVQSELVSEDKTMYNPAKTNLLHAKSLAEQADLGMNISTLTFREAWLEYRRDPLNFSAITPLVRQVFDFQLVDTHRWNGGVKSALRQQMMELVTHLGGKYQQEIGKMYPS